MRIYDTRIAKFLSFDSLRSSYPFYSPYQFAGNMPIKYIDLDGAEPAKPGKKEGEVQNSTNGSDPGNGMESSGKRTN